MGRNNYFLGTSCFVFLLVFCRGQKDDVLKTNQDLVAGLNTMKSDHADAKKYQEKMFTRLESTNKDLQKSNQRLEKMLEKTQSKFMTKVEAVEKSNQRLEKILEKSQTKFLTKFEAVEKSNQRLEKILEKAQSKFLTKVEAVENEMRNQGTINSSTLMNLQSQMLEMKDELMQRFGDFVDHFGNNQSETIADRLREEWTNFSRNISCEVPDLHRPSINDSSDDKSNTIAQGCHQLLKEGVTKDGVYQIHLEGQNSPFSAYCDMTEDGGGWTVIMRRGDYGDNQTDFFRKWSQYRNGFGNLEQEFWLGNEKIHALTSTGEFQLRVTLTAPDGDVLNITYEAFTVDSEERNYTLYIAGADLPTEGAALQKHNGYPFSTWDRHNSIKGGQCATIFKAGWWFENCYYAFLTGYKGNLQPKSALITWDSWKNNVNLKSAEMKIRPKKFR